MDNYKSGGIIDFEKSLLEHSGELEKFIYANIKEHIKSDGKKLMLTAQKYYKNENDINERKKYYIDSTGAKREAKNVSNSKLAHPFMRKLTNQKINYLLSKEFTIQTDDEKFAEFLNEYIDRQFFNRIKNTGRDSIVNGIGWNQVYYDTDSKLKFKRIPSEEVIPFWEDDDHTELSALIRYYIVSHYQDGERKDVTKVEYYTNSGVRYYQITEIGIEPDEDKGDEIQGHFEIYREEENEVVKHKAVWEKIPFVAFKYGADETSLLKWIKPLIDDYDISTSDLSNILQDIPNSIKVVKNYDGTDPGEFNQNISLFRTAFVSDGGDITTLESTTDIATVDSHLERLRKDIYEAGCGVDTQEVNLGNASGVALKFRYIDLDMDTDELANEFSLSLENLIYFIKVDLFQRGLGDFFETDYEIIFNTDTIMNEQEVITALRNSVGLISEQTLIANHPWVLNTQQELNRIKEEREEQDRAIENSMFRFSENVEEDEQGD